MPTQQEYAGKFASLWQMETPLEPSDKRRIISYYNTYARVLRSLGEKPVFTAKEYLDWSPRTPQGFRGMIRGLDLEDKLGKISSADIIRMDQRVNEFTSGQRLTEYAESLLTKLGEVLACSYVSEDLRQQLVFVFKSVYILDGQKAELYVPLPVLGIVLEQNAYGIFDPAAASGIESRLASENFPTAALNANLASLVNSRRSERKP